MAHVVLTGAGDGLGRRVRGRLESDPDVDQLVALDSLHGLGLPELKGAFDGTTVLVHLDDDVDGTRLAVDAATAAGIDQIVLLSTATVYGAWGNNPVPLTEEAPLRPNPGFEPAVRAAERERLAADWRAEHPGAAVAVLRPVRAVAPGEMSPIAAALRASGRLAAVSDDDPPAQFVHLDDVAAAIDLARRQRLDGPFNVAPDGWIAADDLRVLAGRPPVRLPARVVNRVASLMSGGRGTPSVSGASAYGTHSWVVANDRIRAAGWASEYTNEEAYVAGHRAPPWSALSPRRRQELLLGGAVSVLAAGGVAAGVAVRRRLSERQRARRRWGVRAQPPRG